MTDSSVVRARIDEHIKNEASAVLQAMGLTVSDAFRMMLTRIAREKALPFEPLVPNAETVAAMREARKGKLPRFTDVDALIKDLNAGIERTSQFRRDFKREMKGRHRKTLESDLAAILHALVSDAPLAPNVRDHPLAGDWAGFRDCHVRPDLVLIYEKPDPETLRLVRLGSHSELGW